jgi:hypothetical protein
MKKREARKKLIAEEKWEVEGKAVSGRVGKGHGWLNAEGEEEWVRNALLKSALKVVLFRRIGRPVFLHPGTETAGIVRFVFGAGDSRVLQKRKKGEKETRGQEREEGSERKKEGEGVREALEISREKEEPVRTSTTSPSGPRMTSR